MKINNKEFSIVIREELLRFKPGELPVLELEEFYVDGKKVSEFTFKEELKKLNVDDEESNDND